MMSRRSRSGARRLVASLTFPLYTPSAVARNLIARLVQPIDEVIWKMTTGVQMEKKRSVWRRRFGCGAVTILMVLFACTAAYLAVQRYLPYVSPENVCFSRNGVALGGPEMCRQASPQVLSESKLVTGFQAWTPWTWAKHFREVVHRCSKKCDELQGCSFYILRPTRSIEYQIGGGCVTYK